MRKVSKWMCGFFATLSVLNLVGVLKAGSLYEPLPPEMRDNQLSK